MSVVRRVIAAAVAVAVAGGLACSGTPQAQGACNDREVSYVYYGAFAPVSYSADAQADAAATQIHSGYEADLLDAMEAMGEGLTFGRTQVDVWDGIWLRPADDGVDMAGGGMTILDVRTVDAAGSTAVAFTVPHITFRNSLLVRSEDADRLAEFSDLTRSDKVGVFASTTGESRLLEVVGITDADGVLAAGTTVTTADGEVVADGTADYVITAADASQILQGRVGLYPPSPDQPEVVYLDEEYREDEALTAGVVHATSGSAIGQWELAQASQGTLVVSALDPQTEDGGFTIDIDEPELRACIDERLDHLTDGRRIGFEQWVEDPSVFAQRAETWS